MYTAPDLLLNKEPGILYANEVLFSQCYDSTLLRRRPSGYTLGHKFQAPIRCDAGFFRRHLRKEH